MFADSLRLPAFIIGGAPRSGTTWLYRVLERHPRLFLAKPVVPEPKFFLVDDLYRRGLEYYSRNWFAGAPAECLAGEKSSNYLESAAAAKRLRDAIPQVSLIFMLRDPVERAYSNFLWSRKNGLEQESFGKALALEETREAAAAEHRRYSRPHAYFSRGLYADFLQIYFENFPGDQILCLNFDDVRRRPGWVAANVHRFLGVELRAQDGEDLGAVNATEPGSDPMPEGVRRNLAERYAEPNRRLKSLLGEHFALWLNKEWKPALR